MMSDKATMWTGIGVGVACMAGGGILQHYLAGGTEHPFIKVLLYAGTIAILIAIFSGRHVVRAANEERSEAARRRDLRYK